MLMTTKKWIHILSNLYQYSSINQVEILYNLCLESPPFTLMETLILKHTLMATITYHNTTT